MSCDGLSKSRLKSEQLFEMDCPLIVHSQVFIELEFNAIAISPGAQLSIGVSLKFKFGF